MKTFTTMARTLLGATLLLAAVGCAGMEEESVGGPSASAEGDQAGVRPVSAHPDIREGETLFGDDLQVLARSHGTPHALFVDERNALFASVSGTENAAILAVPKVGGVLRPLLSDKFQPWSLAADPVAYYYADLSSLAIRAIYKDATTPSAELAVAKSDPLFIRLGDKDLFWAEVDGTIASVSKTGDDARVLATLDAAPVGIVLDPAHLYVATDAGTLWRVGRVDGIAEKLLTGQSFGSGLAADDERLYWASYEGRSIMTMSKGGGEPTLLASQQYGTAGIAVDRFFVYWTSQGDGSVRRVLKAGGAVEKIAEGQANPTDIIVDLSGVYWLNEGDGTLMKRGL